MFFVEVQTRILLFVNPFVLRKCVWFTGCLDSDLPHCMILVSEVCHTDNNYHTMDVILRLKISSKVCIFIFNLGKKRFAV